MNSLLAETAVSFFILFSINYCKNVVMPDGVCMIIFWLFNTLNFIVRIYIITSHRLLFFSQ